MSSQLIRIGVIRRNPGFSLIELLVVISIVAVLSSVVLVNLSAARTRAENSAIKSSLNSIRGQALVFFSDNSFQYAASSGNNCTNPLTSVFRDPKISEMLLSVNNLGGNVLCRVSKNAWIARTPLKSPEGSSVYWCVDDTGASVGLTQSRVDYLLLNNTVYTCQ